MSRPRLRQQCVREGAWLPDTKCVARTHATHSPYTEAHPQRCDAQTTSCVRRTVVRQLVSRPTTTQGAGRGPCRRRARVKSCLYRSTTARASCGTGGRHRFDSAAATSRRRRSSPCIQIHWQGGPQVLRYSTRRRSRSRRRLLRRRRTFPSCHLHRPSQAASGFAALISSRRLRRIRPRLGAIRAG